jgi:hypothetical protein
VIEWARGQAVEALLGLNALDIAALTPLFAKLGGPGQPDDAREKFQYTLVALQNALRVAQGKPSVPPPPIEGPSDKDWAAE